jgi:hypothetical protein
MLHKARLERFATGKHSSLLDPFVSYEENEVFVNMALEQRLYSLNFFLHNLRMSPIS